MPINSKSLSSALVPTGKRKEDLVEEKINEIILSLLGLTDVFDFTYEEYLSLLKEKMAAQRMQGGGSSEEAELITNEYKRVKGKTGKFKVKAKKVNVNKVVGKAKTQKKSNVRLNSSKLLAGAKDTSSAPASSGGENLQDNSGILNFLKNDLMSALQSINALVSDILDNLKEQRAIDNKKAEQDRKAAEVAEKKEREKNLEGKDSAKKLGGIVDKVKKPFTSFFDQIIKFFTMVLLGSAINFLLKVIKDPTVILKPLVDFINSIVDFLNGIIAWIYNLVITPINGAIGLINTGIQGFINQINSALSIIPGTNPITPPDPIPTIDPMDPTKGLIPQVPQNFGLNIGPQGQQGQQGPQGQQGQQGAQQLVEGGTVYGPGGIDNVNAKLTVGESVLQVGARERQIQSTGIDPLAFNVGPNANKPSFKGGLPGFAGGGLFGSRPAGITALSSGGLLESAVNAVKNIFSGGDNSTTINAGESDADNKDKSDADPVNAMSKSVLKGAKALPIGTMKTKKNRCADTTRQAMELGGKPANQFGKTCTRLGDLDIGPDGKRGPNAFTRNWEAAASFGGSDLGQVIRSESNMKAGDILLWHARAGSDSAKEFNAGAITHVGIAGADGLKGDEAIYDHNKKTGWRLRPHAPWPDNPLFAAVRLKPGGGGKSQSNRASAGSGDALARNTESDRPAGGPLASGPVRSARGPLALPAGGLLAPGPVRPAGGPLASGPVRPAGGPSINIPSPPSSGAGDISFLPLPLNQGAQVPTSSSGPNSASPVSFSAHDPMSVATNAAASIYGIA